MIRSASRSIRNRQLVIVVLFLFLASTRVSAQCPANFNIPVTVCIGESFDAISNNTGAIYEWDFCAGDLEVTPVLDGNTLPTNVFDRPSHITMVLEGGNWYGFVVDRFDDKNITRLDFGPDPANTPTVVSLGNFNNSFSQAIDIEFFKENNSWYALLIDVASNKLYRFFFNTITNPAPTLESLEAFNTLNLLSAPVDIEILNETNSVLALITNYNGSKITQVNFGASITNAPFANPVETKNIVVSGATTFQGIAALKICSVWNVLATSTTNNKIFSLKYTNGLNNDADVSEVVPSGISISQPMGIDLVDDNNMIYAFVQSTGGDLYRLNNADGVNPGGATLGNYSGNNSEGVKLVRSGTNWFAFSVNINTSKINRLKFPFACSSNISFSSIQNPINLSYSQTGQYNISLKVYDNAGNVHSSSKPITVLASIAPVLSMNSENTWCLSSASSFTAIVDDPASISSYAWDWGDGNTSVGQQVSYQYSTAGVYNVLLSVLASNGCHNQTKSKIQIFNPPTSSFDLPSNNPLCTNQNLFFNNTSTFDVGSNPAWHWYINNTLTSTDKNPTFTFTDGSSKTIKLESSINGCAVQSTQVINSLIQGPSVDFSFTGICQSTQTQFTNQTIGSIQTYAWDFDDGNTSSMQHPQNTYTTIGDYSVKLTATNAAGCNNTATKTISIKSKPQPNFSLDLPPFSCNGALSQFNDVTASPPDSNISSWLWSFGDALNGTSAIQHAKYNYATAGQYNVSLTTTTNFGCNATVQKQVTIQQSPLAAFANSAACVNQPTSFVDTSTGSIKSRLWTIGTNTYTTPTVSNTFTASGNFQAQLMVTATNNCVATVTKTIAVPIPPSLDFSVQNNCSGQNAIFTDTTPVGTDPVSTRVWDFANQGTATGSPVQHLFSSSGTYGVKMTTTNQSGCSYPLTKNVVITRTPTANFTAFPQSGPPPLVVQFNNMSANATSYLWKFNDAAGSTSTQLSPSFTFTSLGDYLVQLTATSLQGCSDTFSQEINVIVPLPDLAVDKVDIIRNTTTGTIKMSVSIRNKGNSIISGSSLLVDASGGSLLKENVSSTIRPGETFVYVTNTELVLRADEIKYLCAEINTSDDQDLSNNKECLLVEDEIVYFPTYPNPNEGLLHMDWIAANGAEANVLIVNSFGQKVYSKQIDATREGLNQLEFDVSNLGAGEYILVFQIDGVKKSFRFIRI